jgi:hypothetical protein
MVTDRITRCVQFQKGGGLVRRSLRPSRWCGCSATRITLTILRDNIMRRHYAEPAIHFALVPAARGAPPLREEPYVPDRLYEQLDDQLERFLADEHNNRVDRVQGRLQLSPIFRWYKADFEWRAGSVEDYLRPHLAKGGPPQDYSVSYRSYDWSLNDLHPRK